MFEPIEPLPNFPKLEEKILEFWRKHKIFEKSIEIRKNADSFIFYEGPPTANAKPALHHILARVFKDLFPRYWTMRGRKVLRKAGWDTHGLPVEIQVEKKLGISGKNQIESLKSSVEESIAYFNEQCRQLVWQDIQSWNELTERIGYWLDLDHPYITYETEYIEKLWLIIKQIWDQGLLYRGFKVLPYCPRCGTALSSHEVAQGYKNISEDSVYVLFEKADEPGTYFMSWTTTPWTLPGNVGLAVASDIQYVKVFHQNKKIILAESRLAVLDGEYRIEERYLGQDLIGQTYQPFYDCIPQEVTGKRYQVIPADFVTTEDGSGIVHTAVMYGEEDYQLGEKIGLPKYHTVDAAGKFVDQVKQFAGQYVKDAEKDIIKDLKQRGFLYRVKAHTHSYPFCWRCDSPLLYYARESWFIAMSKLRNELIAENNKINWQPSYIKNGRFGEFLKEVKDWAFSRERYWGTPLPIWRCFSCSKEICFGSIKEIQNRGGNISLLGDPINPHKPYIDKIKLSCDCGGEMQREPYVIDVWFDSGAMPFASGEFEHKRYPADYICEAIDQTRGWFYTLLAVAVLMNQETSYLNVICLGHVNDEKGQKMSKSKGNVIDPGEIVNQYGADALRMYFYSVNQPGEAKLFSIKDLENITRKSLILLWNVYSFFITYSKLDNFQPDSTVKSSHILDQWLKERFNQLLYNLDDRLEKYDVFAASRLTLDFLEELSTWYLRRSRERRDQEFYQTIYDTLINYIKVISPLTPFISDNIYQNLRQENDPESVHLCNWPLKQKYDDNLLQSMKNIRKLVEIAHAQRSAGGIKLRQPLSKATINEKYNFNQELIKILSEEINVELIVKGDISDIKIDTQLNPELIKKGKARELLRLIQNQRKDLHLKPGEPAEIIVRPEDQKEFQDLRELISEELTNKSSVQSITYKDLDDKESQVLDLGANRKIVFSVISMKNDGK